MLKSLSALLPSALAPVTPSLYQVQRYRGILRGWQPMGAPRTARQAALFVDAARRCLPTATLRVVTLVN